MAACGRCNADSGCGDGAALLWCSRCKTIGYCSKECQRLHWKVHKPACYTREEQKLSRKVAKLTTVKDCNFCKRTKKAGEKAFSSCARCRAVRYCSSECQQKDWGTHKDACAPREKSKAPLNQAQKRCQAYTIEAQRCQRAGDRAGLGKAYRKLGLAYFSLDQYSKVIEFNTKYLNISRELRDTTGEGSAYCNLGSAFNRLGQNDKAIEFHTKHLNMSRELGDRAWEGTAYGNLGNVFDSLGQIDKAIEFFTKQLNISRELRNRAGEGSVYGNLGNAFFTLGQIEKAIEFYTKSLNISRELGDRDVEEHAKSNLDRVTRYAQYMQQGT